MSKKENYFIDRIVYKACLLHDTDKGNRDRNIHTDYTDVDITDGRKAGLGRQRRISAEPMSKFNLDAIDKEKHKGQRKQADYCLEREERMKP